MSPFVIGILVIIGMFAFTFLIAAFMFPEDLTPEEEEALVKHIIEQSNDPLNPAIY